GGRGRGALRPAPRRRQRGGGPDAAGDRLEGPGSPVHRAGGAGEGETDGVRPPRVQELRSPGEDHQADGRRDLRGDPAEPLAADRARARADRARGRLLRVAQALPERRLLLRADLPGDGIPGRDVPRPLRDPPDRRLDRPVVAVLLLAARYRAYRMTGSTAVLSDALESIVNVVAAVFAIGGIVFAGRPADRNHPYGHGKIEFFSAAFEGGLISFAAVVILYE